MHSGPGVRLADGLFHIMVVRGNVGRMALVSMLISMDSGEHVNHPAVSIALIHSLQLENRIIQVFGICRLLTDTHANTRRLSYIRRELIAWSRSQPRDSTLLMVRLSHMDRCRLKYYRTEHKC
jgi:hypothetical protein